jgi:hypothetical protein
MKQPEVLLLLVIACFVFVLCLVSLLKGIDGVRLGMGLTILGGIVGYILRAIVKATQTP